MPVFSRCAGYRKPKKMNVTAIVYTLFSLALNGTAFVISIIAVITGSGFSCFVDTFNVVVSVLSALTLLLSLYFAIRYRNRGDHEFSEIMKAIRFKAIMVVYVFVLIGHFIWLSLGYNWMVKGDLNCDEAPTNYGLISTATGCAYLFALVHVAPPFLYACVACCDNDEPEHEILKGEDQEDDV